MRTGFAALFAFASALALGIGPKDPTRILNTMPANPMGEIVVTWRTEEAVSESVGEIIAATADPTKMGEPVQVQATTTEFTVPRTEETVYYHTVTFDGLYPDALYSYRVGGKDGWSEWIDTRTAKGANEPFSFVYFGDAQNDVKSMWSRVVRRGFRDMPDANFMLHAGDLINIPNADPEWADWFYAGGWIHGQIPSVAVPGNHEYMSGQLTPHWQPQFRMPANGPAGLEHTCYTFDYQGTRFVGLNSNERIDEQAEWLDKVLTGFDGWIIVTFHHPVFSTARGRSNEELQAKWQPILQKHKVALVLQGHDHTYGRRNLPFGTNTREGGTVYVVSVSGPKMYVVSDEAKETMVKTGQNVQLYQLIRVTPDRIRYESRDATGKLFDAFEIVQENGVRQIIEGLAD